MVINQVYEKEAEASGNIFQKRVYNCAMYVPIAETVKVILDLPEYASLLINTMLVSADGIYEDYQDGEWFKNFQFKKWRRKIRITIF